MLFSCCPRGTHTHNLGITDLQTLDNEKLQKRKLYNFFELLVLKIRDFNFKNSKIVFTVNAQIKQ